METKTCKTLMRNQHQRRTLDKIQDMILEEEEEEEEEDLDPLRVKPKTTRHRYPLLAVSRSEADYAVTQEVHVFLVTRGSSCANDEAC
jgi:hypothetical protein